MRTSSQLFTVSEWNANGWTTHHMNIMFARMLEDRFLKRRMPLSCCPLRVFHMNRNKSSQKAVVNKRKVLISLCAVMWLVDVKYSVLFRDKRWTDTTSVSTGFWEDPAVSLLLPALPWGWKWCEKSKSTLYSVPHRELRPLLPFFLSFRRRDLLFFSVKWLAYKLQITCNKTIDALRPEPNFSLSSLPFFPFLYWKTTHTHREPHSGLGGFRSNSMCRSRVPLFP